HQKQITQSTAGQHPVWACSDDIITGSFLLSLIYLRL
ncbi:hypothetical protein TrRE_jg5987, partial [Triparma retinervis]